MENQSLFLLLHNTLIPDPTVDEQCLSPDRCFPAHPIPWLFSLGCYHLGYLSNLEDRFGYWIPSVCHVLSQHSPWFLFTGYSNPVKIYVWVLFKPILKKGKPSIIEVVYGNAELKPRLEVLCAWEKWPEEAGEEWGPSSLGHGLCGVGCVFTGNPTHWKSTSGTFISRSIKLYVLPAKLIFLMFKIVTGS